MTSAASLYHSVIADVINNIRDSFLDEAVDENVLQELKTLWETKLAASRTIEPHARPHESQRASGPSARNAASASAASTSSTSASALAAPAAATSNGMDGAVAGGAHSQGQQFLITDPTRLVPVQITIPAQPGNPASSAKALEVHVPAHALQQSGASSVILQQVLTQAITQALNFSESQAAQFLQSEINNAFKLY